MTVKTDTHVHTITSLHADPTVEECARQAKEIGLEAIAITDHCSPYLSNKEKSIEIFMNMKIPPEIDGVRMFKGAEFDFEDYKGHPSFCDHPYEGKESAFDALIEDMDIVIVSPHFLPEKREGSYEEVTEMYVNGARDKRITTLGHIERIPIAFDIEAVVKAAAENYTFIEMNNASLHKGFADIIEKILGYCKKYDAKIIVNSDAHQKERIGQFDDTYEMFSRVGIDERYVVNTTYDKLTDELKKQKAFKYSK